MESGSLASGSSSGDGAIAIQTPPPSRAASTPSAAPYPAIEKNTYAADDPCTWHQTQALCGDPRSCYECLNVLVGRNCTILPAGYCASMSKYDYTLDFRRSANSLSSSNESLAVPGPNYFPSFNTTYCEASDATCAKCRATAFKESTDGIMNPSQFCIGQDGCVCVGFCESTVWKPVAVDMTCRKASITATGQVQLTGAFRTAGLILILCITVPVVLTVGASFRARWLRKRAQARARQVRLDARAPTLVLAGWKALREELIENEHQLQAGQEVGVGAPVSVSLSGGLDPPSVLPESRRREARVQDSEDHTEVPEHDAESPSTT